MNTFSTQVLSQIKQKGLSFPGLDDEAVLNQVLPIAEEWVMMQIVTQHLREDDQALFRDAYLSAPEIFDPVEFLGDILPNLDELTEKYFTVWFKEWSLSLK